MSETFLTSTNDLAIYRASATVIIIRVYSDIRRCLSISKTGPDLISLRPDLSVQIPYDTRCQVDGPSEGWTTIQPGRRPHPTKNIILSHAVYEREGDGAKLPLSAAHWLDVNEVVQRLKDAGPHYSFPLLQRDVHKHKNSIANFDGDSHIWVASTCGYHVCWMQTGVTDRVHILHWHSPDNEADINKDPSIHITSLPIPDDLQDTIQALSFCDETAVLVLRCWDATRLSLVLHFFQF